MARRIATMHLYVLLGVVLAVPVATLGMWQRHVHREERAEALDRRLMTRAQDVANDMSLVLRLVQPNGEIRGGVSGAPGLEQLQAQVEENARLGKVRVVLVDGEGAVLADSARGMPARARYEQTVQRRDAPDAAGADVVDALELNERGEAVAVRLASATVRAPGGDWQVHVSMSKAQIAEGAAAISASTLWVTLGAAFLTVGIILLVGKAMRQDMRQFIDVAKRIGKGDFRPHEEPRSAFLPREAAEMWDAMDATLRLLDEGHRTRQALIADLQRADEHARWLAAGLRDTQDGFLVLDLEQRIVFANPAWLRMRDLEGVAVEGRRAAEIALGKGVPAALLTSIEDTLAANRPWMGSVTSTRRDGNVRELELSISPVFNDKGETEHFVELVRDVTERRAAEHAMQQSERLASLGMLAAGMAHEINNPMTYVLANLDHLNELTAEGMLTVHASAELDLAQCLDDSIHGARRVVEIVADLQALSRQRQDGNAGKASALQTLESCVRMAQSQIRHCAEVVRDFPVDDIWVSINPQRLGQVLLNLILNAAQAMSGGSAATNKLTLKVSMLPDGRGEIAVRDTGSGMSSEVMQRIFDPFFTTKGPGGGTGLGLSISHSIITAAKGEILVESEPDKGTCFRVVLPLASTSPVEASPQGVALRGLSVLVVDDEPGVLTAIGRMLASCRTTMATSATEALEIIDREHFDLVLSDVMMAEKTGVELVHALRDRNSELAKRICLMSAGVIGGELLQEVKSIGVPLLAKPMTSQELHQALWRVHRGEA